MFSSATKSAAQGGGYKITKSLRFRSSASAYLNRTFGTPTNNRIFTVSFWFKIGSLTPWNSTSACFQFSKNGANNIGTYIQGYSTNQYDIGIGEYNVSAWTWQVTTANLLRDPSSWYHVVFAVDTTQATASNRIKIYINGVAATLSIANYPSQNFIPSMNNALYNSIGSISGASQFFDGQITEYNFVDGQQLTPASFGSTDATTGVWQPIKYTGTYGNNGFYLPFTNTTSTTTLGYDTSGNGNNWTTNNFSLTTGSTYDSMTDVPTLTSATVANYAVMNPLSSTTGTFADGNLYFYGASSWKTAASTISLPTTGKFYCEAIVSGSPYLPRDATSAYGGFGILKLDSSFNNATAPLSTTAGLFLCDSGYYNNFAGSATNSGSTLSSGDVIGLALDLGANTYTFYKNNSSLVSGTIGTTSGTPFVIAIASYNTNYGTFKPNFGQQPFSYTPPSGYVALNTYNLSTPTIPAGNKYMDATTYTGNGSTQSITNAGSFKPDLVWLKSRSAATSNVLTDSVRGTTSQLYSNSTTSQGSFTDMLTAFNSNGYSLGVDANGSVNVNGSTYVGWQWQAGQGTTSSNTNGSITSTVSVNPTAGFSIIKYTGNNTAGATIGHGLGVAPKLVIARRYNAALDWVTWHTALSGSQYLYLNSTAAAATDTTYWNSTIPNSTVITLGSDTGVNGSAYNNICYAWAEIAGFSKFGSYTGNGSTDGPFIYTGFRPKYVLIKSSSGVRAWQLEDSTRNTYNPTGLDLRPNVSDAETNDSPVMDFVSNGFKQRNTYGDFNNSGETYIYAAFAENPFKYSLAR